MCVLMVIEDTNKRPSRLMIEKAITANPDYAGLAWREENKKGDVEVVWQKGLADIDAIMELIETLPVPFLFHARAQSVGPKIPEMAHPFHIDKKATTALFGRTKGAVLFHNGTWKEWFEWGKEAAIRSHTPIPVGKWSDTRAMAWLCSIYGWGFMEFLPEQKAVIFSPTDLRVFEGGGWKKVGPDEIWCSNDVFMTKGWTLSSTFCKFPTCRARSGFDKDGYCHEHPGGYVKNDRRESPQSTTGTKKETPARSVAANLPLVDNRLTCADVKPGAQGGSTTHKVIPFHIVPTGQIVSVEIAETLAKDRVISKQLMKRIKNYHHQLTKGGERAKQNALMNLEIISKALTSSAG